MSDIDRLLTEAGERWRAGQPEPPPVGPIEVGRSRRFRLEWPAAAVVLVVALVAGVATVGGRPQPSTNIGMGSDGTPSLAPSASFGPTATPMPSIELVDGLPKAIDGVRILVGAAARAAIQASADSDPILIGGWLHAPVVLFCPMVLTPDPFNSCFRGRLYASPFGGSEMIGLVQLHGGPTLPSLGDDEVQPVVVAVHTHDPACPSPGACALTPVFDAIVWSGRIAPVSAPTSTRPPAGFSEAAAIEAAILVAAEHSSTGPTVLSAVAGHYAEVGPGGGDVAGDRWVWAITLGGAFPAPDCGSGAAASSCRAVGSTSLVVLDYVDGTFLISTTPAPF
jgi:hypothetical protein